MFTDTSPAEGLRRIFLNALSLLFAYGLPKAFTLGAVVVAARVLGTGDFGAYGTAAALAFVAAIAYFSDYRRQTALIVLVVGLAKAAALASACPRY